MGAEEIGGLGDLLHIAIQCVNAAGQEIHHTAGHGLIHILHVDDHGLVVPQIVGGLGGVVEAARAEQHNLLLIGRGAGVQHGAIEAGAAAQRAGTGRRNGAETKIAVLFLLRLIFYRGCSAGAAGRGTAAGRSFLFFLVFVLSILFVFVVIIVIVVGIGSGKLFHVVPKAHFCFSSCIFTSSDEQWCNLLHRKWRCLCEPWCCPRRRHPRSRRTFP